MVNGSLSSKGMSLLCCKFDCSLFFKQEMELSLIGLQNAGKTSLVNVVAVSTIIMLTFSSYRIIYTLGLIH